MIRYNYQLRMGMMPMISKNEGVKELLKVWIVIAGVILVTTDVKILRHDHVNGLAQNAIIENIK